MPNDELSKPNLEESVAPPGALRRDDVEIGVFESEVIDKIETNNKCPSRNNPVVSPFELALVKKLDRRIFPIICVMYFFEFLDRSNLGNARLQGLPEVVLGGDPNGTLFDWVNSAVFFSYVLTQIPANILSKLCPPRVWLGSASIGWGICCTLMATAFNFAGLVVARIGIGVFESGFGPGIPLYLSYFYTKTELGLRMAYWFGFAAIASAVGGLIAFGIQHVHSDIGNWRLLFIIEGVPSVIMGFVAYTFLPDRPEMTKFLNESEREIAISRMNRDTSGDTGLTINKVHIISALLDWRIYCGGVIYFGLNCSLASLSAFLPTIIKSLGYSMFNHSHQRRLAVVLLTAASYLSDRIQSRGPIMASCCAIGGIGYVILLVVHDNIHVRYFATFCITSGTFTTIGLTITWFAHNLGSETKRAAGIPMFMAIGQCGSILGSYVFPSTEGPKYIRGFAITCAMGFLAGICAIVLSMSYRLDNDRRNRLYGRPVTNTKADTSELADKANMFRYVP